MVIILLVLLLTGCKRDLNDIIENEPNISGIVTETQDGAILIQAESGDYWVSLDVEYSDSMTHFNVGDEAVVYYDGVVAESWPMQINGVYAITLRTPAE